MPSAQIYFPYSSKELIVPFPKYWTRLKGRTCCMITVGRKLVLPYLLWNPARCANCYSFFNHAIDKKPTVWRLCSSLNYFKCLYFLFFGLSQYRALQYRLCSSTRLMSHVTDMFVSIYTVCWQHPKGWLNVTPFKVEPLTVIFDVLSQMLSTVQMALWTPSKWEVAHITSVSHAHTIGCDLWIIL
jgi:hypothetical protein